MYIVPEDIDMYMLALPEGMDAVDDTRHILPVIQVSRDWIEDLYIGRYIGRYMLHD